MIPENTVASKIAEKKPEAFDLLQKMLDKPAMFVGTNRFDYVYHLFSGYCLGSGADLEFMPSKELQYWLLHTQSASLSGEISGRSLFFRCFGIGQIAFDQYKAFLYAKMPEKWPEIDANDDPLVKALAAHDQGVDVEIYSYESNYNLVRHNLINDGIPTDNTNFIRAAVKSIKQFGEVRYNWTDDIEPDHNIKLAQTVVDNVYKMIRNSDIEPDELKIYVRKERLFTQVRFLYRCGQKWSDDSAIIASSDNHALLIAIHASAKNASSEALRECGCYVFDNQDYEFMFVPDISVYNDGKTFYSEFSYWKDEINLD